MAPGCRSGAGLTFPTKVPSDSLGRIGSLKRTSDKSLFPMALGSCGHRITHQLRPINMNGRSILSETSTIILSPRGGGRGNSRQGRRWCRVARADGDSQVSALGVDLPSGAPFACKHRLKHRNRTPGQQGLRVGANLLGRNLDGKQITWKQRTCS